MAQQQQSIVVVGGGLAGAKACEALRAEGYSGRLTLLGAERYRPYERPPLSKGYLQGSAERDKVFVHPDSWYAENDVDLRLSSRVTGIDRSGHVVITDDGDRIPWTKLVLATGASPRRIDVPGADLAGVRYLRSLDDSDGLREAFTAGARVVVVGGGWIGLEAAAAARAAGADVTVLEVAELPLLRVLGPEIAQVFADVHRANGVVLELGVGVDSFVADAADASKVGAVRLSDGRELPADVLVVGVGATPEVALAESAGLDVDNGVLVDEHLRTSDPDVAAIGDIANAWHPFYGRRLRVEHWANALNQPAVAARSLLGKEAVYERPPYFYTDQFELGMEYTGWADPAECEVVVRGDLASREFIAFWLKDGQVQAGMNVNVWDVTDPIKALIASRESVDVQKLADPAVPLTDLVSG